MAAIFEPSFTKLKPTFCQSQDLKPKLRLKPFVKSIKAEPMGSSKMFQMIWPLTLP